MVCHRERDRSLVALADSFCKQNAVALFSREKKVGHRKDIQGDMIQIGNELYAR